MSADFKPKIKIDEYYKKIFNRIMNNSQYDDIRPLFIALYEKIVICEKQKKNNFISKSTNTIVEVLIGVNIGIFVYADKPFESIESKGLALSTILLIISLFLFNFMGDTD